MQTHSLTPQICAALHRTYNMILKTTQKACDNENQLKGKKNIIHDFFFGSETTKTCPVKAKTDCVKVACAVHTSSHTNKSEDNNYIYIAEMAN